MKVNIPLWFFFSSHWPIIDLNVVVGGFGVHSTWLVGIHAPLRRSNNWVWTEKTLSWIIARCLFIYIAHQSNFHLICLSAVHYSQLPFVFSASYVEKRRIRHFCSTLLRLNWRYEEYVTQYVKNQSWNIYGTILIAPDKECLNIKNYFLANMTNIYHHLINRKNITTTVPPLVGSLLSILSTFALAGSWCTRMLTACCSDFMRPISCFIFPLHGSWVAGLITQLYGGFVVNFMYSI